MMKKIFLYKYLFIIFVLCSFFLSFAKESLALACAASGVMCNGSCTGSQVCYRNWNTETCYCDWPPDPTATTAPSCRDLGNSCDIDNPCCSPHSCSGSYGGTCYDSPTCDTDGDGVCNTSDPYCTYECEKAANCTSDQIYIEKTIYCRTYSSCMICSTQTNAESTQCGLCSSGSTTPMPTSCQIYACYDMGDSRCQVSFPGCPGGVGYCDNCGGTDCGPCGDPVPTQTSCTANCLNPAISPCISTTCYNKTCLGNCNQYCYGTKPNNCACAATTCVGSTCGGTCGDNCAGTLTQTAGTWGACKADCGRDCTLGRCGGACIGTAPSCAVNGTFSSWSPNNCSPLCGQTVTRTCSGTCGGTCSDGEGSIKSKKCTIDEELTKCNSATTQQYLETPQTTGTVWIRTNDCTALVSGVKFGTWNPYNDQDDLVWYNSGNQGGGDWQAAVNISSHQPNPNNTIIIHPYLWGCQRTNPLVIGDTGLEFIPSQKTIILNPKTCSVGVSNASATQGKGVKITTTGNAHINPGWDTVRSFVSKESNPAIVGGVTYDYGGSTGISALLDGNNYYNLVNTNLVSTNSNTTSSSYVVHAPPGTYRVHCDVPSGLDGNYVKCSGNPNCTINGGSITCINWKDCGNNDWATFTILPPPSLSGFTIRRGSDWNYMPKDSSNRSHTCDLYLADTALPRGVVYVAHVYNPAGFDNIGTVQIRWKGDLTTIMNMTNMPEYNSGNNAVYYVVANLGTDKNKSSALGFEINMTNDDGDSSGWVSIRTDPTTTGTVNSNPALNVERTLKIWNCQVPISGSLYEAIDGFPVCSTNSTGSFIDANKLKGGANFASLKFSDSPDVTITSIGPPADYGLPLGTDKILWGKTYLPFINGGTAGNIDGTLLAAGRVTRMIDLGIGTTRCPGSSSLEIGYTRPADGIYNVSPYSDNPQVKIDFAFIRDQEAWYQVVGAGVKSKGALTYGVPVTAPVASRFLTLGNSTVYNGLVSAISFTNNNGNNYKDDLGGPGLPEPYRNWYVLRNTNDLDIYNYNYFYNNFFVKAGVGETKSSWGGWEKNKIYFVDGALSIATSSPVINPNSETFMVIVKGTINIDPSVKRLDGIYIADGSINVGGTSVDQLIINGMLYADGDINLSRSFSDKTSNNANPAVKVNYSPGLIFNLDPKVLRVLSGWREE